jgi:uncharacterized protein DUF6446
MNGKLVISIMLAISFAIPAGIYYFQVYAYYFEVEPTGPQDVQMVTLSDGTSEPVPQTGFQAIDATSSPIRYRACFNTTLSLDAVRARYVAAPDVEPRNAPGWFDCFDAGILDGELKAGTAATFLGVKNIAFGIDQIIAITQDGRGYIWHSPNNCEAKDYEGTVVGEDCPPLPTGN